MRLINANALYEKTAEWEAQALHMVEVTMNDEDKTEWRMWSAVLKERSAFKFDIADAPTIEERKKGKWIRSTDGEGESWICSECMEEYTPTDAFEEFPNYAHYCPNCGTKMLGGNYECAECRIL